MMEEIAAAYRQRMQDIQQKLDGLKARYNLYAYGRLGIFVMGVALTYFLVSFNGLVGILAGLASLVLFLYLVKLHTDLADHRDHLKRLAEVQEDEISFLEGKWDHFDPGNAFIDHDHAYSSDLDIFGRASLYQFLNRTGTSMGHQQLAAWLRFPEQDQAKIRARQAAIQELSKDIDWSLNFQALAKGHSEGDTDQPSVILDWLKQPIYFLHHPVYKVLLWLLPSLFALSFAAWIIFDLPAVKAATGGFVFPGWVSLAFFLGQLGVVGLNLTRTAEQHQQIGRKSRMLGKYGALLREIESGKFSSEVLQSDQASLKTEGETAGDQIQRLAQLSYMFDQRLNIFAGLFLNGIMMWDLRYLSRLEKWKEGHQADMSHWFEVIGQWDALVSFARLAYNRPELIYPTIEEGAFHFTSKQLGHVLLDPERRVDNNMSLGKPGEFLVITGANMAGKSTFLRTVGVNLILGMNGAPVCAEEMAFVPIPMITSVRAHDSLSDNESYFYAELKQLKKIIDALKEGAPLFIIVDEMLRGTNSRDKMVGSRKFIEQLIQLKGVGMIATHDLSLGTLADDYPDFARNKRFEVEIEEEQLRFDYTLRDGISQNLNATFLMQQMGIMPKE
ncbi:MAG: hypothetical protein AAFR61_01385 [Bacteroidota bacterium]